MKKYYLICNVHQLDSSFVLPKKAALVKASVWLEKPTCRNVALTWLVLAASSLS